MPTTPYIPLIGKRPRKRRPRHRPQLPSAGPPPPPPAVNQIVAVTRTVGIDDQVIVTVSSPVVGAPTPLALWVSFDDNTWIPTLGSNFDDPLHGVFLFDQDVSACAFWHVEDPGVWEFLDGVPMSGPFDGEIVEG